MLKDPLQAIIGYEPLPVMDWFPYGEFGWRLAWSSKKASRGVVICTLLLTFFFCKSHRLDIHHISRAALVFFFSIFRSTDGHLWGLYPTGSHVSFGASPLYTRTYTGIKDGERRSQCGVGKVIPFWVFTFVGLVGGSCRSTLFKTSYQELGMVFAFVLLFSTPLGRLSALPSM